MKTSLSIFVLSILLFTNCKQEKKVAYTPIEQGVASTINHPGKKLMETHCYVCHSPTATMNDRIAPPMIAIKKHYISETTTKDVFISDIQNWILNPNETDSKMFGAIRKFGLMPKTPFPKETIQQIAEYMFEYDIEQPEWFESHSNKAHGKGKGKGKGMGKKHASVANQTLSYKDKGLKYALGTKAVLGKNLMGTIQNKGLLEAIAFCNVKAYPLTDSMSVVYNASIKRVSDQPRNPKNQADAVELKHINAFKKVISNGQEPEPIIEDKGETVDFYYPITTNTMCLQCHREPSKQLNAEAYTAIKALYPKDLAIGYKSNEVRGVWRINFEKE